MSSRTSTPTEVVQSFIQAWNASDLERILAHLHADVIYHNMPVEPLHGRAAVKAYLDSKGGLGNEAGYDRIRWRLLAIAAVGNKVLTERVDDFRLKGVSVSLPLMGIFEIEDGLIRAWRDYFDMDTYRRQVAAPARS